MKTNARYHKMFHLLLLLPFLLILNDAYCDQAGKNLVIGKIKTAEASGKPLSWNEYYQFQEDTSTTLAPAESAECWKTLRESQKKPAIAKDELVRLFEAKQKSIKSFSTTILIDQQITSATEKTSTPNLRNRAKQEYDFSMSGEKIFVLRKNREDNSIIEAVAYDGKVTRRMQANRRSQLSGTVSNNTKKTVFLSDLYECQLGLSGLIRSSEYGDEYLGSLDVATFAKNSDSILFDRVETQSGVRTVCLCSMNECIFLDIDREYAVVAIETWSNIQGKKTRSRKVGNRDFVKYNNEIWLPTTSTDEQVVSARSTPYTRIYNIRFENTKFNTTIPDEVFSNVFPAGIRISDQTTGNTYVSEPFQPTGK